MQIFVKKKRKIEKYQESKKMAEQGQEQGQIEMVEQPGPSPAVQPPIPRKQSKLESRISGTVKWFNAKYGYGFITRHDTNEDVFVHFSGIARKNPRHSMKSLGDGELVEFNLMAASVTGPGGRAVKGNPYVSYIPRRIEQPRNGRDAGAAGDNPMRDYIPPQRRGDYSGNSSSTEHYQERPVRPPRYDNQGQGRGRGGYRGGRSYIPRFQENGQRNY